MTAAPNRWLGPMAGPRWPIAVVLAMSVVHGSLLAWESWHDAPMWDEVAHLPAGLSHWQLGRFDLYRVNPPLVRMLAAAPVLMASPSTDWSAVQISPGNRSEFEVGRRFVAANGPRVFRLFAVARFACIPLSLGAGLLCFVWATELYGRLGGLIAATLWYFCPNALGYGHLITPDVGGAAFGLLACYCFGRWLSKPTFPRSAAAGAALALALLAKSTWIIAFALWPCIWLGLTVVGREGLRARLREAAGLGVMLIVALFALNAGYAFSGACERLGDYTFVSSTLAGTSPDGAAGYRGNRFATSSLRWIPVPVPRDFLLGLDTQKRDFENKMWSYLRGEWRLGGWWYYYTYAFAVKTPIGSQLLIGASLAMMLLGVPRGPMLGEAVLLVTAAAVTFVVSVNTGFNHHFRYVAPALPLLYVLAGRNAHWLRGVTRVPAFMVVGVLLSVVVSSARAFPHHVAYFNEFVGCRNGHYHLAHSNTDWGQDLLRFRDWLDKNPDARPMHFAYDNMVLDPMVAGIDCPAPPIGPQATADSEPGEAPLHVADFVDRSSLGPRPGWYALSVNQIHNRTRKYEYFLKFEPHCVIGWSIHVYHITEAQAGRERRSYGLPPWSKSAHGENRASSAALVAE